MKDEGKTSAWRKSRVEDEARLRAEAKYRERHARFNILESPPLSPPSPPRILHLECSAVMQVTIGACRCLPRPEIPIMEMDRTSFPILQVPVSFYTEICLGNFTRRGGTVPENRSPSPR